MEWFTRVLVCTDFSAPGNRAVTSAFKLCGDGSASVILAHVLDRVATPNPLYAHYYPQGSLDQQAQDKAARAAEQAMLDLVPESAARRGISVQTRVMQGKPENEILKAAADEQVDVIVIGTHGRTGLDRLILGSVAERVVRQAECAVLVVH